MMTAVGSRYSVRLTRFDDRRSFQRVVEFLAGLYPDRTQAHFQSALARTPCTISHDADERAAEALRTSLQKRGAHVLLIPNELAVLGQTGKVRSMASTVELSPEVDLSFLDKARRSRQEQAKSQPGSATAVPDPTSSNWDVDESGKAPWER